MVQKNHLISAEVILKSKSGRSLANEDVAITSDNIKEFSPTDYTIKEAIHRIQELGFTTPQAGVTLTIVGSLSLFENVFQVKLTETEDDDLAGGGSMEIHSSKEPVIPSTLKDIVEKIVFIPPPRYFV